MIRIGLCQTKLSFEQPEENLARMERFLLCASGQADLLMFPELTLTGFTMDSERFALDCGSPLISRVRDLAVRYRVAVGFGHVGRIEQTNRMPQNQYDIIDKEGNLLAEYAKLHPFSYSGEDRHYSPGNALSTFTMQDVRIGITVCYDLRFPEIYQAYADTCDAIIVAANWPAGRSSHWTALLEARAVETQCYMAGVNCVGDMDGQYYSGKSRILGPGGEILAGGSEKDGEEMLLLAEIDPAQVRAAREAFPVRRDRRNSFYRALL